MTHLIGRGRYARETYPSPPASGGGGTVDWPFGPFFTRVPPPPVGSVSPNWVPVNFTQQGSQATAPTFTDAGPTGNGGVALVSPNGVLALQGQELAIEDTNSPWTFIAGTTVNDTIISTTNNLGAAGVFVRDSSSGGILMVGPGISKGASGIIPGVLVVTLSNPTTPTFVEGFGVTMPGSPFLTKMVFDGTDISVSMSVDGVTYLQLLTGTPASLIGGLASSVGIANLPAVNIEAALLCWQADLTQP